MILAEDPSHERHTRKGADEGDRKSGDQRRDRENSETGYGIDVGFLYDFSDRIRIGATAQDVLGKVGDEDFPMVINAGMAMNVTERLTFAADYRDFFFTQSSNIFNKVYFGAEYDMPLLDFRGGFSQGYPSAGIGIKDPDATHRW